MPPESIAPVSPAEDETGVESVAVEVIKLDPEAKTLTGRDKFGTQFLFHYASKTKIRTMGSSESVTTVAMFIVRKSALPLRAGQDILVKWKADAEKNQRAAVELVIFE